jgi:GH35 family endo-1,4-beta-xylanase
MSIKKILTAVAVSALIAIPASAQQSAKGLKDYYANYFRTGTCPPTSVRLGTTLNNQPANLRNLILKEFNSVTPEDELKPSYTMVQNGSTDTDIKVQLSTGAREIMKFCADNNIPMRGHTLVWHSQTPDWFFYANMQNGNQQNLATPAVMNQRMESYIKNMFALIASEFPALKLYAYDVVNEIYENDGKPRNAGFGGDNSPWVSIYGNNSFADSAFVYAKKYAPATCKLFYNDFNEYHPDGKRDSIAAMATRLGPGGKKVLDGIGMQSHLSTSWPPVATYKSALTKFIGVHKDLEIHVTELDITIESGSNEAKQVELYTDVFTALKEAREEGANITSVTIWGVRDNDSWRSDRNPLVFNSNYQAKPAYTAIAGLIPEKDWGSGTNPQFNTPKPGEVAADANGFYFYHDFENNTTMGWNRRGDATVTNVTTQKNSGSRSLHITGRNQNWNGAMFTLPSHFKGGNVYSFSVMARSPTAGEISLSFQYDNPSGTESYGNIGTVDAAANQWVQIANARCTLPAGSNFAIYVEAAAASAEIFFDDAMGGTPGTTINADGTPGTPGTTSARIARIAVRAPAPIAAVKGRTLTVSESAGSKVRIRVINMNGKTVAKFNAAGGSSLSLRKIPAGSYAIETLNVKTGAKTATSIILR